MKILKILDEKLEEYFLVVLLFIMVVLIFAQIVMRYVFSNSLSWSEELSRYLFLWITWVGSSYGVKKKSHVAITVLEKKMPGAGKVVLTVIISLIWLCFALFLSIKGFELFNKIAEMDVRSPSMQMPMKFAYASVPVGATLMTLRLIQNFIEYFRKVKGAN